MDEHKPKRYPLIDYLRFIAIFTMVIFHFSYDLNSFNYVSIDFNKDPFWFWFPRFIVFCFMICVGMGLQISHAKGINWPKLGKRVFKLSICALCISLFTYFAFPKNWIYFGTLHSIAICSFLGVFFVNSPKLSLTLALILNFLYWGLDIKLVPLSYTWGIRSMDYIPLYPWFGIVLFGIYLQHTKIHSYFRNYPLPAWLEYCSRYSLRIYLIHQPVLFSLIGAFYYAHKYFLS